MITAEQIRERLSDYKRGKTSFEDFDDWFAANSWNAHRICPSSLQNLIYEVEAKLAEYTGGYVDESSLRTNLALFVKQYSADVA